MPRTTRRTQEERSAATRAALLDATIDCLVDHGYVHTTALLVAERAGVSRGACTHHFPTTEALIVAAIERMFSRLADDFAGRFERMPAVARSFDRVVDELWTIVRGPSYVAVLEIVVASRTDESLADAVRSLVVVLEDTVADLIGRLFPALVDDPELAVIVDVLMAVVQGAAVSRLAGFGRPDVVIAWAKQATAQMGAPSRMAMPATDTDPAMAVRATALRPSVDPTSTPDRWSATVATTNPIT